MTTSASGKSEGMVILVVGSGGREHAIAWKLSQSKRVQKVLVAPGNGGTARGLSKVENVPGVKADDVEGLVRVAKSSGTSFVVVGPEIPLVKGLADALAPHGIKCFGPKAKAAELEGSKAFSKDLMAKYGIPTAEYRNFKDYDAALAYVRNAKHEVVIKASGLAAGKGVLLPESLEEAEHALKEIMQDRRFGEAGAEVVIEERLEGEECSLLAFTDGRVVRAMPAAQDHKRIFDGDKGPNTGGMGAYAPAPVLTPRLRRMAVETALQRAVDAMAKEGRTFAGVIYAGLMISPDGKDFKVLEYNCRFGDPETQVILPLLRTDLVDVMEACAEGRLDKLDVQWHDRSVAATVVAASEGYPGSYPKGRTISGLDKVPSDAATTRVFQAGTRLDSATGLVQTSGGRVLAVTGVASNLTEALGGAYRRLSSIRFDGMQFRRDIARRAIERPLRIGVLGSTRGTDMQVILDSVAAGKLNARVAVVVSNRKRAGILDKARAGGVLGAHFVSVKGKKDREAYDAEVTSILENYGVDLVLMIGYMRIVSGAFVRRWWNRCLNVHPSLLPDFGGGMDMDVHAEVIKAKKRVSGCTVHFVTEEVDGGAIVEQMQCSVASDETPETLKVKVQLLEGAALINAVQRFARGDLDAIMRAHPLPRSSDSNTAATKDDAPSKISYAQAGVDIEAGEELVSMIGPACKRTARSGCDADLGGFGGLFDLAAAGYDAADTLIVGATDGVGTKLLLAERSGEHGTIGQDLVAMCVNDLIVQGAEPLFFLDYYATGKLTNAVASKVVTGIADGCSLAGCALIGGETAEMPQMYDGSRYDLAGFAVGAVRKSQLLPRAVRAGDVCLGLAASGVHSNGFSLVRKIVDVLGGDDLYNKRPPFDSQHPTLVRALLEPTKIYVKSLLALLKNVEIRALAHITGGGLVQNIPRVLGSDVDVAIDLNSWPLLPVFKWFVGSKRVTQEEMLKTFNCGIGMVVIVPADKADAAKAILEKNGESVYTIGKACKGTGIVRTTGILA